MSIVMTYDVFCDGTNPATGGPCSQWTHGATGQGGARVARQIACASGWRRRRVDGELLDLCPVCVAGMDQPRQA